MKTRVKSHYCAAFKTKVVLELLLARTTLQALSCKYQVSIQSIYRWKKQLLSSAFIVFGTKKIPMHETEAIQKLKQKRNTLQQEIQKMQHEIKNNLNQYEEQTTQKHELHSIILPRNHHTKIIPFALGS